jgi:transcriptional regulator with XRE-family HTH domain
VHRRPKEGKQLELSERDLAAALIRLRKAPGISQEELADESGYHRTYISQLERGLKSPSLRALNSLARALGISTCGLVSEIEREAALRSVPSGRSK